MKLCGTDMKETKTLKYLGDFLSSNLEDSVHQTVLRRVGVIKQTILDIRRVTKDTKADSAGTVDTAFTIWTHAIQPKLIHNSETWVGILKKIIKILDDIFIYFSRIIWRTSSGSPIPNFFWITGCYRMTNIILQKKLEYYHHLANLESDSLGGVFFDIQAENDLDGPNLKKEVDEHIRVIGFSDLRSITKWAWKRKVKQYIHQKQKAELIKEAKRYKKLNTDKMSQDSYERKSFLSALKLEDARMLYKVPSKVVPTVRSHFLRRYGSTSLSCPGCSSESDQSQCRDSSTHILLHCDAYADLMDKDLDPDNDIMLAQFFRSVVERKLDSGDG